MIFISVHVSFSNFTVLPELSGLSFGFHSRNADSIGEGFVVGLAEGLRAVTELLAEPSRGADGIEGEVGNAPDRLLPNSPRAHEECQRNPALRHRSSRMRHCSRPRPLAMSQLPRCRVTAHSASRALLASASF
jgi:hypothetical protein